MAIFVDENTKVVVQGITGRDGSFHTLQMMEYGTTVVAGVTPGKGGQTFEGPDGAGVPIFNTMDKAVAETGANTSVVYVPPAFAAGAIEEAADAGVSLIVAINRGGSGARYGSGARLRARSRGAGLGAELSWGHLSRKGKGRYYSGQHRNARTRGCYFSLGNAHL